MTSSIALLDKYVKAAGHASDSAAARALKVQPSAVNNWRHGRAHPDPESVARMCEATGESVAHWLPLIEADRARTPEAKKVWLRLAQMAAAITLAVGLSPTHAETITTHAAFAESATSIHYAKFWVGLCRRLRIGTALAWLLSLTHGKRQCHAAALA